MTELRHHTIAGKLASKNAQKGCGSRLQTIHLQQLLLVIDRKIQGRTDDVLKIAGHRIGTAEVESAVVSHKAVVEAGAIGVPDEIRGEIIKIFVILKKGIKGTDGLKIKLKKQVRKILGPIAIIKDIEFVEKLPKTRSGKIMRRVLKAKELNLPLGDTSSLI